LPRLEECTIVLGIFSCRPNGNLIWCIPKDIVDKVAAALATAHPDLYPQPDQHILLDRILWARWLSPAAKFRVGREDDWWGGRWIHACTRDRRNVSELKRLWQQGIREYEGKRIMGTADEP
jgi:hypothetical protein